MDGRFANGRITGAVTYEQPVVSFVAVIVVPGNANHGSVVTQQAANDVVFYPAIDQHYFVLARAVNGFLFNAYQIHQVLFVGVVPIYFLFVDNNFSQHASVFA